MASRFDNYDKQASPFPPKCQNDKLKPFSPNKPFEDYNAEGELVGYWWGYGDTVNLEFNIDGYVVVDGESTYITARDFIKDKNIKITLYNFRHEEIVSKTYEGSNYQIPTYSVVNGVTYLTKGVYYTYTKTPDGGVYTAVDLPSAYVDGTTYYKQDEIKVVFNIDEELAKQLVRGTYYCSLQVVTTNDDFAYTLFYQEDTTFTIR